MIEFFVPGQPQPGGSKKAFYNAKLHRSMIVDANPKAKGWQSDVRFAASATHKGEPIHKPLSLTVVFHMPRPKYHFKKNGELRDDAPYFHTIKPDATKLLRSTEDALTGIVWADDSQVAEQVVRKIYSMTPGAHISVEPLQEEDLV